VKPLTAPSTSPGERAGLALDLRLRRAQVAGIAHLVDGEVVAAVRREVALGAEEQYVMFFVQLRILGASLRVDGGMLRSI
jgi:hypothetical protein